ncbi:hypothetical protein JKA74_18960 [Marivirga sp. S37H4]|uniref:Uncharacterized protein n=1 Tax=Marivirga aurantiaca TaxID=2802615 RepID=A0A935CC11_9BACT|nr:hypothetical protein [Marivirga aurantiaca]MBK6267132.1 hypothetical protein [Marivirga aurantiaca]
MRNTKILRIVYWVLWTIVVLVFYYSLRYAGEQAMEYTLAALFFWALTFGLNKYIKKIEEEKKE